MRPSIYIVQNISIFVYYIYNYYLIRIDDILLNNHAVELYYFKSVKVLTSWIVNSIIIQAEIFSFSSNNK